MKKLALFAAALCLCGSLVGEESMLSNIITPRGETNPQTINKQIVKEFYDAFSKEDARKMNDLLASNYGVQDSNVIFDSSYSKYDAFSKNFDVRMKSLHQALPNFNLTIIETMSEANKVLARIQITGIQRGPFLGVEPTDKPVTIKMFVLFSIEAGKITHINEVWNEFDVMKQIGFIVLN